MQLRKAAIEEYGAVRDFYWNLIDEMSGRNDTVEWKKGIYPSDEFLKDSIENGTMYVMDGDSGILAGVILNSSWNEGYDGLPWGIECSEDDVLVPHALAVKAGAQKRGIGKKVVQDIIDIAKSEGRKTIRLDILRGNIAAEHLYTGLGFRYVQSRNMFYEDTGWKEFMMYEMVL